MTQKRIYHLCVKKTSDIKSIVHLKQHTNQPWHYSLPSAQPSQPYIRPLINNTLIDCLLYSSSKKPLVIASTFGVTSHITKKNRKHRCEPEPNPSNDNATMVNKSPEMYPPSITQQRAFAYAPKPFALLSFLSSLWIIYRLIVRCHCSAKRQTMYHRLILSAAICISILSFCLFWGTWAMPVGTTYAVGASGTANTCTAQGFLYDWAFIAFPFYYASFSVLALVSVKNNFKEEEYAWIEKWIHLLAYVPPLIFVICATVRGWIQPNVAFCSFRAAHEAWRVSPNAVIWLFYHLL